MRYLLALAESFWQRWHAELDLRSLKSVPQMDVLRGKKPEMVQKELWTHLLSYNLIRKVMAQAGEVHHAAGAPHPASGGACPRRRTSGGDQARRSPTLRQDAARVQTEQPRRRRTPRRRLRYDRRKKSLCPARA